MAKKKQGNVVQMLSPENYIRKKARALPIHKCLVNAGWEVDGLANLMVSRKHTNGHFTVGTYLVDTKCLGIKDCGYQFNMSESHYADLLSDSHNRMEIVEIPYALAHNIVYAAVEFADEFGLKPHRDFTSVAQYILDEDTDDVELIEIECGNNGKPLFVIGPYDTDAYVRSVTSTLEKTAGPGNYDVMNFVDDDVEEDFADDDQ